MRTKYVRHLVFTVGLWAACNTNLGDAAPLLLWSAFEGGGFYTANLDGSNVQHVVENTASNSTGITYDPISGQVYWGDIYGTIWTAGIDGVGHQVFLSPQTSAIWNMVVHDRRLFFNAEGGDTVHSPHRVDLNATNLVKIGSDYGGESLAIDHSRGHVFYQGFVPGVGRLEQLADTDGSSLPLNLTNQLASNAIIRGMFVDESNDHLYYTVDGSGIWRSNLDGSDQTFISNPSNQSEYSIFVDAANDTLYWSTYEGTVGRMGLNGEDVAILHTSSVEIYALTLYDPVPEPSALLLFSVGWLIFPRRFSRTSDSDNCNQATGKR